MHFVKPLDAGRPEGLWQKLVMSTAGIGYYGRGDSIDVHFHREDGSMGVVSGKRVEPSRMRFEPLVDLPAVREPDALAFAFRGDLLLVRDGQPLTAGELDGLEPLPLGRLDGRLCLAYELPDDYEAGNGLELEPCGRCGAGCRSAVDARRTRAADGRVVPGPRVLRAVRHAHRPPPGRARPRLPDCGLTAYPRLAPAVIVLIERDGAALLCHGVRFPGRCTRAWRGSSSRASRSRSACTARSPRRPASR